MTRLLEQAFQKASSLTPAEQDELGQRWLAELEDDAAWDARFGESEAQLGKWAARVRDQIKQGRAVRKGIDEL